MLPHKVRKEKEKTWEVMKERFQNAKLDSKCVSPKSSLFRKEKIKRKGSGHPTINIFEDMQKVWKELGNQNFIQTLRKGGEKAAKKVDCSKYGLLSF